MRVDPAVARAAKPFLTGERETFATVLVSALIRLYGAEALNWSPETIELQLKEDLSVEMPAPQWDQMQALIAVLTSDLFYQDVEVFDRTVSALVLSPTHGEHEIPAVEDVVWTVTETSLADPGHAGKFSLNIALYCGVVLQDEGFMKPPSVLGFAKLSGQIAGNGNNVDEYQAAYQARDAELDEVNQWVGRRVAMMIDHLAELGIHVDHQALSLELQELNT